MARRNNRNDRNDRLQNNLYAQLNVTWAGQNGNLQDPVRYDATDYEVKAWATEAIRSGAILGVAQDRRADLTHFVVERFASTIDVPYARIIVRPKTPFGAA